MASAPGPIWRAAIIKNTIEDTVQLKAVRAGDAVTVGGVPLRVKAAQRNDAGLVTLKLENEPARPMTMVGVPDMRVVRATAS
ncbi:hypothetical protein [Arthrobacter globiformis]|uniref:hypothetical protein n=1 Tax=Arthrobacter globiformis TaxID=1665 RepID=UPI001552717F|nr:hypothetical protein [Arthrobacter globiformis]